MTYFIMRWIILVKHGIDVSKFQGVIDWQEVKKHIDFAIIRCGYGSDDENQDDPFFKRNADECTRLKIPFGVYLVALIINTWQFIRSGVG